jgi:hypothetical protein
MKAVIIITFLQEFLSVYKAYHAPFRFLSVRGSNSLSMSRIDSDLYLSNEPQLVNKEYKYITLTSSTSTLVEIARFEAYTSLRKNFQKFLLAEGCVSRRGWIRAFERWQFNSKISELDILQNENYNEPLLPSSNNINEDFIADIKN